ncbi:MAG: hypothetical protein N3A54_00315 [Patescibacteria group bacterium]|nr:hypothetical protein [Patescibacteria group bacterium]
MIYYLKNIRKKLLTFLDKRPLISFFGLLALIVFVIVLGNFLRRPSQTVDETKKTPKQVEIFSIGQSPRVSLTGKVEKSGVIKIVAQSPGIVQTIHRSEGARVAKGTVLFYLSSNYQGGNISSLNRQLAQKNARLTEENYPRQKELIQKRREIAEKTDTMSDDMRKITRDSIENTKQLIALNREILDTINTNIKTLEETNTSGSNDALILQAKQAKSGVVSALNSLETGLRNAEYSSADGNPQARLSDLGREVILKQLEIEEKALESAKEIAVINLKIAQIAESLMFPSSPCNGVIERVYVQFGRSVNPGQPLASILCDITTTQVIVPVSREIAESLSRIEQSTLFIGNELFSVTPRYISKEPTDGTLHTVLFTLSEDIGGKVSDGASVRVDLPIENKKSLSSIPYVPIDAVFQTQTSSIVYVASQSAEGTWMAEGRTVKLGQVFGSFVEITQGVYPADQIILTRNIIAGDEVRF